MARRFIVEMADLLVDVDAPNQGGKPICFLVEIVSVMARRPAVRCGKSPAGASNVGRGRFHTAPAA